MMIDDDNYTIELFRMIVNWTPYGSFFNAEENPVVALGHLKKSYKDISSVFPDYIILDLKMPELSGIEFIREFESCFPEKKGRTIFIISTSSIIKKDREEAFSFECVKDYIIKPLPRDYIEKLIVKGL
jgi:CheY-like chemotaxis protein